MKLFMNLLSRLVEWCLTTYTLILAVLGFVLVILLLIFFPIYNLPHTLFQTRCPKCKGFFKGRKVNLGLERKGQAAFMGESGTKLWECKDPDCGNKWETQEYYDWDGTLEN